MMRLRSEKYYGRFCWIYWLGHMCLLGNCSTQLLRQMDIQDVDRQTSERIGNKGAVPAAYEDHSNHRLVGTVAVTFAVGHMALQLVYDTLSITGIVAVAVIVLSGVTGIALSVKRRNGVLLAHRVFTFASLICLAIHVLVAG